MPTVYEKHMKKLWKLAGKIGAKGEREELPEDRYSRVYQKLAEALDVAEQTGLIRHIEEN